MLQRLVQSDALRSTKRARSCLQLLARLIIFAWTGSLTLLWRVPEAARTSPYQARIQNRLYRGSPRSDLGPTRRNHGANRERHSEGARVVLAAYQVNSRAGDRDDGCGSRRSRPAW